ncbi:flagellar export chaperone FliS [Sporolactobacillus sp. THM19-2]|uniref:flagellar export chaperone FliS n=1 Tax=Sporolactobacillus sp. THM19-2 TaxID=2511171 RepID=UPI001020A94A|nr:flagellar export chaperone FliS [Sporolactobacillus sp. THM19-2]RYL93650.1 flagellar export chaperone FliS [Sporolactobacillus sp. THM19-2]
MPASAYKAYQQNSVLTATPGELTLMLYDGCIKFIRQAKLAMNKNDIEKKNVNLQKAQAIIHELMVTLDQKQPVAKSMMQLYDYIYRRMIEANLKNDLEILDEVEGLVTDFRDTWKQVIAITQKNQPKRNRA